MLLLSHLQLFNINNYVLYFLVKNVVFRDICAKRITNSYLFLGRLVTAIFVDKARSTPTLRLANCGPRIQILAKCGIVYSTSRMSPPCDSRLRVQKLVDEGEVRTPMDRSELIY